MRISDWSSDVCSSDLETLWLKPLPHGLMTARLPATRILPTCSKSPSPLPMPWKVRWSMASSLPSRTTSRRSEEHTSELQSLMRISYAVFCLKKKTKTRASKQEIQQHYAHPMREQRIGQMERRPPQQSR